MTSLDELRNVLVMTGWAKPADIVGCSEVEIGQLEASFSVNLPRVYKEFLRTMGKNAGQFEIDSAWNFSSLGRVQETAKDSLLEIAPATFFFLENSGSQFLCFDCTSSDDPPVLIYELPSQKPSVFCRSLSEWFSRSSAEILETHKNQLESKSNRKPSIKIKTPRE